MVTLLATLDVAIDEKLLPTVDDTVVVWTICG